MDIIKDNMHPNLKLLCASILPFQNDLDQLISYVGEVDAQRRACLHAGVKTFVSDSDQRQNENHYNSNSPNYNPKYFPKRPDHSYNESSNYPPKFFLKRSDPSQEKFSKPNFKSNEHGTSKPKSNDTFPRNDVTCFNCGKFGHRFRTCQRPKTEFCEWCGRKNVTTNKCPDCKPKNGKRG